MTRLERTSETGATLVVSLIMLTLITLMILAALAIGGANFRTVTNMQFRDEAIAAANTALDQVTSSSFTDDPVAEQIYVDLDNDDTDDYEVNIDPPQCIRVTLAATTPPSSLSLPPTMSTASSWNTVWDIRATVAPVSGFNAGEATVVVHTGVRVLLSTAQKDLVCTT